MKELNILKIIKTIQENKDLIKPKYKNIGFEVSIDKEFNINILEIYIPTKALRPVLKREEKIRKLFKADRCMYVDKMLIGEDPFWAISWRFKGNLNKRDWYGS